MANIHHVWKNRRSILEGIKNNTFKKEHIELIAQDRMEKCMACPHIDNEGKDCLVPGTAPCCKLCGCKLAWKLRSLSEECPDGRWGEMLLTPDEEFEMLSPKEEENGS